MKYLVISLFSITFFSLSSLAQGKLKITAYPSNVFPQMRDYIVVNKVLDPYVDYINRKYAFQQDIPAIYCDCGVKNAFYKPSEKKIVVCYEYIQEKLNKLVSVFGKENYTQKIQGATILTLLHELGHALASQNQLIITGKEEDAVDEFALITLLDSKEMDFVMPAFYGIMNWYYSSSFLERRLGISTNSIYADEHSPSLERYYTLLLNPLIKWT